MTIDFKTLIFIWLLPLAVLTSAQNHNFTVGTTGQGTEKARIQSTTQEATSLAPPSEVNLTTVSAVIVNGSEEKAVTRPSLQTRQTTPPNIFLLKTQTAASPTDLGGPTGTTSAGEQSEVMKSTAMSGTVQAANPTKPTTAAPKPTLSQETGSTSTSGFTRVTKAPDVPTRPPHSTTIISTATTSTKSEEDQSESTHPVTGGGGGGGGVAKSTVQNSLTTPLINTTKQKKSQDPPRKKATSPPGANTGKIVAGLIGGALVLMIVGFVVIYIKKRKLQKQQITTSDWAGPSPFLEHEADNGQVKLRSSNRISLSGFLPHRLSKRLTLLPEMDETELEDVTTGTTFGGQHEEKPLGQKEDGNDAKQSNGSGAVVQEIKSTGDDTVAVENSETSTQTNNTESTNNNSEVANLSQDKSENPSDQSGAVEKTAEQMKDDLEKP